MAYRIIVVDDDTANLKIAGHILSRNGMHVTALRSGRALLHYLGEHLPDLILLDIKMPDMDGFETFRKIRGLQGGAAAVPVIFLTADESKGSESTGLSLGAADYIVKPFVPEVLLLRVQHILELTALRGKFAVEDCKAQDRYELLTDVVRALTDAVDAKDSYSTGHSGRVAAYAREIARRAGYSEAAQEEIYLMGLLHDVGKIGVPETIINKPAKLSDEEFEVIRNHPVMGARILRSIRQNPKLAAGARWHHERYNGKGYPDGLSGEEIPEEARILAVADAYDAMTSSRSFRSPKTQAEARREIADGRGVQFDPKFADIMLNMMDEDPDFTMREY